MERRSLVAAADRSVGDDIAKAMAVVKLKIDVHVGDDRPTDYDEYRLAVCQLGEGFADPKPVLQQLPPSAHVILVVQSLSVEEIVRWMKQDRRIHHLLTNPLDSKQIAHLRHIGIKLATGDCFGLERYLGLEWEMGYRRVVSADDRSQALSRVGAFARRDRGHRAAAAAPEAAELLLNHAMYAVPVDAQDQPVFEDTALGACSTRNAPASVSLRYARRGSHLYLSVRDRYGSLTRESLIRDLDKSADKDASAGVRLATTKASRIVLNLLPGRVLEVISVYEQKNTSGLRMFSLTAHPGGKAPEEPQKGAEDGGTDMFFAVPSSFWTG